MATIFRTTINYREEAPQGEVNTMPSETQPDEVLSVRELLQRHVQGLPVSGGSEPYFSDEYVPDLRSLDLTEMEDLRDHYAQEAKRIKKAITDRQKAEFDKAVKKEAEKASKKDVTPEAPSAKDSKDIPE